MTYSVIEPSVSDPHTTCLLGVLQLDAELVHPRAVRVPDPRGAADAESRNVLCVSVCEGGTEGGSDGRTESMMGDKKQVSVLSRLIFIHFLETRVKYRLILYRPENIAFWSWWLTHTFLSSTVSDVDCNCT